MASMKSNGDISTKHSHTYFPYYSMVSNTHTRSKNRKEKVTPQQTLERVRENQRRHRARRRDYIITLEAKLDESEQTIVALRKQVDTLQAESIQCRQYSNKTAIAILSQTPLPAPLNTTPTVDVDLRSGCKFETGQDKTVTSTEICPANSRELMQNDRPLPIFESAMETQFRDITYGESTMLCEEAYRLIGQQNFKGVNEKDVATWLWNGFRKSLRPSEGCRVKTDMLFGLLAFISDEKGVDIWEDGMASMGSF